MRILVFEAGNLDSRNNKIPMKTQYSKKMTALLALALLAILGATTNASVVDLVNGNSGSANDGQFIWTPEQPTGTGVIDPFVRVQADGSEQGYNTSGGTPFDEKAGIWTHDIFFLNDTPTTPTGEPAAEGASSSAKRAWASACRLRAS